MPIDCVLLNIFLNAGGADHVDSPSRDQIFASAEQLRSESGILQLLFEGATESEESIVEIVVNSESGQYFTVEGVVGDLKLLLIDAKLPIPRTFVESELKVGETTENCFQHNTVTDFDTVLKALELYVDSEEFLDVDSYTWINIDDKKHQNRYR